MNRRLTPVYCCQNGKILYERDVLFVTLETNVLKSRCAFMLVVVKKIDDSTGFINFMTRRRIQNPLRAYNSDSITLVGNLSRPMDLKFNIVKVLMLLKYNFKKIYYGTNY